MNQRIQQLAKESGLYIDVNSRSYPKSMSAEESVVAYDTFAKLIIQECAHLVDTLNQAYDAPSTAGEFIKTYFEIEKET